MTESNYHTGAMFVLRHFINNHIKGHQNDPIKCEYTRLGMELFNYLGKLDIQKHPEMRYKKFAQDEFDDADELSTTEKDNVVEINMEQRKMYKDYSTKKKLLFIWKSKKVKIVFSIFVTDTNKVFSAYEKRQGGEYNLLWHYVDHVNSNHKLIDKMNKKLIKLTLKKYLPKKKTL